jgi:hypothetical protein
MQSNLIFYDNVHILCYSAISKSPKQLPNCLKRAESSAVLIVFSSPCQRQSELLPSLVVRRLSSTVR